MPQSNPIQPAQLHHPHFICPHCQSPLIPNAKTWQCDGSKNPKNTLHPFDVARQGYVNLLPVQNKKTKHPGDSQDAIDARHRFLNQGFYQPLQQLIGNIADQIGKDTNHTESQIWLDIGCGEGYYTQAIAEILKTPSILSLNYLIAIDISKPAVLQLTKTAKRRRQLWSQAQVCQQNVNEILKPNVNVMLSPVYPAVYPIVASASHLPLANNSVDIISSIFSPILPSELARVLRQGGHLLIAKPDVGHLQSLREALFDEVRPHDSDKFLDALEPYFKLTDTHQVQAELSLDTQALADLLTMTPYSYRAKAEKREALLALAEQETFQTQAKFVVYELVRV